MPLKEPLQYEIWDAELAMSNRGCLVVLNAAAQIGLYDKILSSLCNQIGSLHKRVGSWWGRSALDPPQSYFLPSSSPVSSDLDSNLSDDI